MRTHAADCCLPIFTTQLALLALLALRPLGKEDIESAPLTPEDEASVNKPLDSRIPPTPEAACHPATTTHPSRTPALTHLTRTP